jgi:hypothetical protein
MILQRAGVIAACLTMATIFGLAGAGPASAAAPAQIKPNSIWTLEIPAVPGCEHDQFSTASHTFVSDNFADSGTWSSGAGTVSMAWTTGADNGLTFSGHFLSTTTPVEYKGSVSSGNAKAKLVKGAVGSYKGFTC